MSERIVGPISLFDKSFLQKLTVDESVWFDHYFSALVSPMFYVETLADLAKQVREGRTPEREVRIIADKFPIMHSTPCTHHAEMGLANLMGQFIPMDGSPPYLAGIR